MLVVVPARDEERLIGRCLGALREAVAFAAISHPSVVVRTVVVADACVDDTEQLALSEGTADVVVSRAGRVGHAREHGITHGLAAFAGADLERTWIGNTDADSAVPANWIAHQIEAADGGADVLVGTVRPDPLDLTDEQDAAWRASHQRGRPNGHVHGANLGLRASAHRAVGGFEPVDEHEDNLLVARLRRLGLVILASDRAEVLTSGRFVGRTPGGYAAHLAGSL
ncbi:glycosyl transferase [Frondihabitans sucicola]|uniref:4,4'-diaponeurosporenoate glycosyltransferase n=1 Tax=Frondihabitans sucicola TaxID=1268041 RepID=A0ABN6XYD8_9MICO|nr:glycosyl transferase [Frondihabitans sucicola]